MALHFVTIFPRIIFANIENIIFSLSTSCLSGVLFLCSCYVFFRQSFGDFILCSDFNDDQHLASKAVGSFCFYNVRVPEFTDARITSRNDSNPLTKHDIYQWVPYILFFQSLLFYVPKLLLKRLEGITFNIAMPFFVKEESLLASENDTIKIYKVYKRFLRILEANNYFALGRIICEFFNVLIIVLQIYLMKINLGTKFYEDVYSGNPFDIVFPKEIHCTQPKFGLNGTIERNVVKCELPINYVNESIYTYLWVCVNLLLGLTTLVLLYRLLSMALYSSNNGFNRFEFKRLCWGRLKQDDLMVTSKGGFSRWLILRRLAGEMSGDDFGLLIEALSSKAAANIEVMR